jgi:hypothetical protein
LFIFPRDISHLRNAYHEAVQSGKSTGAPATDLDFSLKDVDSGKDSIPTFSKTQTPLSENGELNELMGGIRRQRIRVVELNAANVLDLLFLTRVLRAQCPDTRVLLSNPDLLFVQAAQTSPMSGILAFSSYPLFFGL